MNRNELSTDGIYFITITVVDWIDIFIRPKYKHIIVDSLAYCQQQKGLNIYAWVLMSNHLHAIISTDEPYTVSNALRDFKKFTSKRILEELKNDCQESRREWMFDKFCFATTHDKKRLKYRLWQDGYHPELLHTHLFCQQKLDYIHANPVKQEIVTQPEDYLYSSAIDYAGGKGLIEIKKL